MTEHEMQAEIFRQIRGTKKRPGLIIVYPELELLYAVPNQRDKNRLWMWQEGVNPGIPDLCLPVPREPYHGLYIELKTSTGKVSSEQERKIELLKQQGYRVHEIREVWIAIEEIINYLRLSKW